MRTETSRGRGVLCAAVACSVLLLTAAVSGCDDGPPPGPAVTPRADWTPQRTSAADELGATLTRLPGANDVVVRLAFGPQSDLDLYVTGPLEETVYYANTPSRIGGELVEDRRCEHPGTRVEEVRFVSGLVPGRYRVGVDYPRACGESRLPAPFAITVDGPTGRRAHRAIAVHQVFEPVVLEFEVRAADAAQNDPEDNR